MNKKLLFGATAQEKLIEGVDALADAVGVTIGAKGRLVAIDRVGQQPQFTKDGYTVAHSIAFGDNAKNMGAAALREAAAKCVYLTGDGTTTTTLLAQMIIRYGFAAINAGKNPVEVKNEIDRSVKLIVEKLKSLTIPITPERVRQIATISANGEIEIGNIIAEAVEQAGENGSMQIENTGEAQSRVTVKSGAVYNCGLASPYYVTNPSKMTAEYEYPYIIIVGGKIKRWNDLQVVLQKCGDKAVVIIADDFELEVNATLVANKLKNGMPFALVKAPQHGDKRLILEDMAVLLGASVIDESKGIQMTKKHNNVSDKHFGTAAKVIIGADSFSIIHGGGDEAVIQEYAENLKAQIEIADIKEPLKERLTKLIGKVAIVSIGGATDAEIREKRDRADDALGATNAAIAEGVVAGGGVALIHCMGDDISPIVNQALGYPALKILSNAGLENINAIIEKIATAKIQTYGYNVANDKMGDMIEMGIIDPVKVVRCALENAASVAGMILTTNCVAELAVNENYAGR